MISSSVAGTPSSHLVGAMEALWQLPDSAWKNLTETPLYAQLVDAIEPYCADARRFFGGISMSCALAGLGLPCGLPESKKHLAMTAREAAERLQAALEATCFTRVHLMPLDLADGLPRACFGNAVVGRLTKDELAELVDLDRMERVHPGKSFDLDEFSQFQWLVVREQVSIRRGPEGRELFRFSFDPKQDYGRIEPHRGKYPEAVETALFWLALAPWEIWSDAPHIEWRGMQIPWLYSVDHDLFSTMKRPPSSDTLTWEDRIAHDAEGRSVDISQPVAMWLRDGSADALTEHFAGRAQAIAQLPQLQLFQTPVAHFFCRAFLTDGIDEFMSHLLAIEAALGLPLDYKRKSSSGVGTHDKLGATERVCARLVALLDEQATSDYRELFELRSEFLHGRSMQAIPALLRVRARTLARRVVDSLVLANQSDQALVRDAFLDELLDRGVPLLPAKNQRA